jgi:hypothetical protein
LRVHGLAVTGDQVPPALASRRAVGRGSCGYPLTHAIRIPAPGLNVHLRKVVAPCLVIINRISILLVLAHFLTGLFCLRDHIVTMSGVELALGSISLSSLCLQATQTTFSLVEGMKSPDPSHKDLLQVLADLRVLLRATESVFVTSNTTSPASSSLFLQINEISQILVALVPKLRKDKKSTRFRILTKSRNLDVNIKDLRHRVEELRSTVEAIGVSSELNLR